MKYKIEFVAEYVKAGRGRSSLKGGTLTGELHFDTQGMEDPPTEADLEKQSEKAIAAPCLQFIRNHRKHSDKTILNITTQIIILG